MTTKLNQEMQRPPRSWMQLVFDRFRRHKLAMVSVVVLGLILVLHMAAPLFDRYDPTYIDAINRNQGPSMTHFFGTDNLGRDIWSRVLYGGRVSLTVAIVAVIISLGIGTMLGLLS